MPFWKKKPLVALPLHEYQWLIFDALAEGITTTKRFALFAQTTADSARLINDLFSEDDPDDPEKLLYVDDFVYDLPISRAPESEMYVFLIFALHVAVAYCNEIIDDPATNWVPAAQQQFYPEGRLHELDISTDLFNAYYLYGDDGLIRFGRSHWINRQELQFVGMCMIYTLLAAYATKTNKPITDVIDTFETDLARPGPTFTKILKLPPRAQ
jgi:hypothetical protein